MNIWQKVARTIVHDLEGNVLVVMSHKRLRSSEPCWSFPGGKVEDGESSKRAAIRKLRQETGLRAKSVRLVQKMDKHIPEGLGEGVDRYTLYQGLVSDYRVSIRASEIAEYQWVTAQELLVLPFDPLYAEMFAYTNVIGALLRH